MQFVAIPVPEDRIQEVYALLAQEASTASRQGEYRAQHSSDPDLELVARVADESPEAIRNLLRYLAERPNESIAFADLARAIGMPHHNLRAEMAQFSARWKDKYGQGDRAWFFDVIPTAGGRVLYRMTSRVADAVLRGLGPGKRPVRS
jgi:hypothetical protein